MHEDEIDVTLDVVRRLVARQYPQWAGRRIRRLQTSGTVNAIFRLGDDLAARFPLRAMNVDQARDWLQAEAAASAEFGEISTVPAPITVAIGEPGESYPLPWTMQTWVPGEDATVEDPGDSDAFALDLAELIASLRAADPAGRTFAGSGRGGHLTDHDAWVETCLQRSAGLMDVGRLRAMWTDLRGLPEVDEHLLCHRDLTPPNILVRRGRLAGVLDTGGFGPADPALDLVSAWHLLDHSRRQLLREALQIGDVQWLRGMAWAFEQAIGLVWYYAESNPTMSAWGRRTLDRLLAAQP